MKPGDRVVLTRDVGSWRMGSRGAFVERLTVDGSSFPNVVRMDADSDRICFRDSEIAFDEGDLCPKTIFWWDVSIRANCRRPAYHSGPHSDGLNWFDDNGLQVPRDQ